MPLSYGLVPHLSKKLSKLPHDLNGRVKSIDQLQTEREKIMVCPVGQGSEERFGIGKM